MNKSEQQNEMPEQLLTSLEDLTSEIVDLQELMLMLACAAENIPDLSIYSVSETRH